MNTKYKSIIIIPAYNCEKQIKRVLESIHLNKTTTITEVLVIDNCSTDCTLDEIRKFKDSFNLKILSHTENYGLGGSFKSAYRYARDNEFKYVYWFHGDDQASFTDLQEMEKIITEDETVDCIFGARFSPGSKLRNYSKIREYGNKILNLIFSLLLRKRIFELGSGLNVYKVRSLPESIPSWPNHIAFDINLIFHYSDKDIKWLPITWTESDQVSNANNIKVALRLLSMLLMFVFTGRIITDSRNKVPTKYKII